MKTQIVLQLRNNNVQSCPAAATFAKTDLSKTEVS